MRISLFYAPCQEWHDGELQQTIYTRMEVKLHPDDLLAAGLDEARLDKACEQFKSDLRGVFAAIAEKPEDFRQVIPESREL